MRRFSSAVVPSTRCAWYRQLLPKIDTQPIGDSAVSRSSGFSAAASPGRQVCEKITGRATEKRSDATSRNHAALSSPVIIPISI